MSKILLGVHSHYSLMRGTAGVQAICRQASTLGYTHIALTDRNNLYGLWPFLNACKSEKIRPIIGAEITDQKNGIRAFCLVKNSSGYSTLCQLLSTRHLDKNFNLKAVLPEYSRGLCIMTDNSALLELWHDQGLEVIAALACKPDKKSFQLRELAKKRGIMSVVVADSYFLRPAGHKLHQLLRAIDTNTTFSRLAPSECVSRDHWLTAPADFAKRFTIWPEAINNASHIARQCTFDGPDFGLVLPPYKNISTLEANQELKEKAFQGARSRYGDKLEQKVVSRLEHELKVIGDMGFSTYFLVVHDIVRPVSRTCGRGSGAASLVAYCLRITNVCPVKHKLYFARFLNPGRQDAPDIDIDFAWDERDAIIKMVLEKYGEHAAMVCNHVCLKPRMAIRETAKVFGLPDDEIGRVSKRLPWFRSGPDKNNLLDTLKKMPELRDVDFDKPWPEIIQLSERLAGTPRYLSVHPGGVVITPEPIANYVPIERAKKGVPIIQWEKDATEEAGLVKIDLLGNRSLGVIRDAISQLQANGHLLDENKWEPEDDKSTQIEVAAGNTMGCFYIESPAMRLLQKKARQGDFEHLVIHSSIIRPAANEFIREYVRRLRGGAWQALHQELDGVLDDTFGIMVYQEDVSRVAVKFGFSDVDADRLRKIMSKKDKWKKLADYKEQFFAGARAKKVEQETTEKIWQMMMSFDGYSFCKPHSASYAKVSFQAAFLKTHYPAEFMAAVISNQGGFYSTFAYVSETKRLGVRVLAPDVNKSSIAWHGKDRCLRVGLMAVKHLSSQTMTNIVARQQEKPFVSLQDFLGRVKPDEEEARSLVHGGALDSLIAQSKPRQVSNRAQMLYQLANWQKRKHLPYKNELFANQAVMPDFPPESLLARLRNEYRSLGFLCTHHPISLFHKERERSHGIAAKDITHYVGKQISFLGWLITAKIVGTKSGEAMEFLTFEDETGQVECTLFPKIYRRHCHLLHRRGPLLLKGIVEDDFGALTLTVERARAVQRV